MFTEFLKNYNNNYYNINFLIFKKYLKFWEKQKYLVKNI